MEILQAIKERRSIREFQDRPLPEEAMKDFLEALRWAPSAGNLQSRFFYFVFNADLRRRLAEAALGQEPVAQAPLVVVACADRRIADHYGRRGTELYMLQDVATSLQNLLLVVHAKGLGAVWTGAFDEERVRSVLEPPDHLRPVALVPIGYPNEHPLAPPRLPAKDVGRVVR
jgi:nitroreductase